MTGCHQPVDDAWQTKGKPVSTQQTDGKLIITLGDIDPDTPTARMHRIRPLAHQIARDLDWSKSQVKVRIARSVDEMALMLSDGRVDLYLDSAYPSLLAKRKAGSTVVLQSQVSGKSSYHAMLVTTDSSSIDVPRQLIGKTIAFQEPYSTSGYLLPAAQLLSQNFQLQYTTGPGRLPESDKVGYFFSGDKENTLALLREGFVVAGAIASTDYDRLSADVKGELRVLLPTEEVPRKLVSLRPGFNQVSVEMLTSLLLNLNDADPASITRANSWNWKFEVLSPESQKKLTATETMISLLEARVSNE